MVDLFLLMMGASLIIVGLLILKVIEILITDH
jgi:hypothetical protein